MPETLAALQQQLQELEASRALQSKRSSIVEQALQQAAEELQGHELAALTAKEPFSV